MEKKNLSTTEQGAILAYFMNFNILYFKNSLGIRREIGNPKDEKEAFKITTKKVILSSRIVEIIK